MFMGWKWVVGVVKIHVRPSRCRYQLSHFDFHSQIRIHVMRNKNVIANLIYVTISQPHYHNGEFTNIGRGHYSSCP